MEDRLDNVWYAVVRDGMGVQSAARAVNGPWRYRVQCQTPFAFVPTKLRRIRPLKFHIERAFRGGERVVPMEINAGSKEFRLGVWEVPALSFWLEDAACIFRNNV